MRWWGFGSCFVRVVSLSFSPWDDVCLVSVDLWFFNFIHFCFVLFCLYFDLFQGECFCDIHNCWEGGSLMNLHQSFGPSFSSFSTSISYLSLSFFCNLCITLFSHVYVYNSPCFRKGNVLLLFYCYFLLQYIADPCIGWVVSLIICAIADIRAFICSVIGIFLTTSTAYWPAIACIFVILEFLTFAALKGICYK